jgi:hypothetical protein
VAYVFLILFWGFAFLCTIYLIRNDFAGETLEVLFPAAGAVLLSMYLGFKSVVIDAPVVKKFSTTVAVLHDQDTGTVSGMAPNSVRFPPRYREFRGLRIFDLMSLTEAFKTLNMSRALHQTSYQPLGEADKIKFHMLEYAIIKWFLEEDALVGYKPMTSTRIINSEGGGGGMPSDLVDVPVGKGADEDNPFFKYEDLKLRLPAGSSIVREDKINSPFFNFTIITRHSTVRVSVSGATSEELLPPIGEEAERIYAALGVTRPSEHLIITGYAVDFETRQNAFSRFSNQAKKEAEWIDKLQSQFERDFSWKRLRDLYARDSNPD